MLTFGVDADHVLETQTDMVPNDIGKGCVPLYHP